MRKNSARRWLHFTLDLLPVILIPVFMIYSHRHVLTETKDVDIQYKYQSNEVNSKDDIVLGNIYHMEEYDIGAISLLNATLRVYKYDEIALNTSGDNYLDEYNFASYSNDTDNFLDISIYIDDDNSEYSIEIYFTNGNTYAAVLFDTYDLQLYDFVFSIEDLDDLTSFKDTLNNVNGISYTDYNVIESVTVEDTNTDIMHVFMNNFNTSVDNYFNFDNVFNFGQIKAWLNTNIFSGNMPAVINSVWQIFCYEFLMDLIFLLYALFMFFIDFCTNIIDRFHTKCKGGD